jgi:hypothetical protein
MIGQYLLNTNENATVSICKKNLQLNKANFLDVVSVIFLFYLIINV